MRIVFMIWALSICFYDLRASPQAPDFLIIGKDTFAIYFLPINKLDSARRNAFFRNLQSGKGNGFAVNLWRGYQAYWQLAEGKLFLVGFRNCRNADSILKVSFPENYDHGKVLASWFSSYLAIARGKQLKWDGIFSTTYFKEQILEFSQGVLTNSKIVYNYKHVKHGISRLDRKEETDTIFSKISRLNWDKLSDCGCDDRYLITINDQGKIGKIESISIFDTKKERDEDSVDHIICVKEFIKQLKSLQFDIITWNGKTYNEKISFEVMYVDQILKNRSDD
jgi:hypothetical protein